MKSLFSLLFIVFSFNLFASDCGLHGTVQERLSSCQNESTPVVGYPVISRIGIEKFIYDKNRDRIISPPYGEGDGHKCPKHYVKKKKLFNDPKNSFRCVLNNASKYILVQDEFAL